MYTALQTGAIGIKDITLPGQIQLAADYGFMGLSFSIEEVEKMGVERAKELFSEKNVRPAAWGLPVNFRADDATFESSLDRLRQLTATAKKLQCYRTATWILPFSDDRPFKENLEWHRNRLGRIARILADHGCSFGLEFIGPRTLRKSHKYEFIYTMDGMLELCAKIGTGNVGLLLDAWHLYTSHGKVEDLTKLKDKDVVVVHVNDAPRGIAVDDQIDNRRCLPGETGVIDIVAFMKGLSGIGYSGPVIAEPFSESVNKMPAADAARATSESLSKIWKQAGLKE
jgi:sugar phosphate isomerase/epimerase